MIGALHDVTLRALGSETIDAEGIVQRSAPVDVVVRGRVDELSTEDVNLAAQVGQTHDVVVKVDLGVLVNDRMTVVVTVPENLAGTYKVDSIRQTRKGQRVLCSRTTIREP